MTTKINSILSEVLEKIDLSKQELDEINSLLKEFLAKVKKKIKSLKINADVFIGGSFAKKTAIKKDYYDVDIFVRFDQKYKDKEMSKLTGRILKPIKRVSMVHGSRDYYRVKVAKGVFFELVPVTKIKNLKQARNITDLSYSHVKYIKKKIKSEKILQDIKIAKAFCHANKCYGAESYINGFSGYGLELLVSYYGSFLKFIKAISKNKDREVIDIEKHYKNKQDILMDLNSSKLQSPIILIDPTHKQRNALAALSKKTLERFQKDCKQFLKNPSAKAFELKQTNVEKMKMQAAKNKHEFILLEIKTNKQEGDIAGSKLLKFYNHLNHEISKFFDVKKKGFNYNLQKSAKCFFVVKNKKQIEVCGPNKKDLKNVKAFKKKHKKCFVKKNRICAKETIKFNIKQFINSWKIKNKKRMKEMYIRELKFW